MNHVSVFHFFKMSHNVQFKPQANGGGRIPLSWTSLGFPCFHYSLSAFLLSLTVLYLDWWRWGCSVAGNPPPPRRVGWPPAPISEAAPTAGRQAVWGKFPLVVGLTGDGDAEHAGKLVSFLGPMLVGGGSDRCWVFLLCSFPGCD